MWPALVSWLPLNYASPERGTQRGVRIQGHRQCLIALPNYATFSTVVDNADTVSG